MRDGQTRRLERRNDDHGVSDYLRAHEVRLVVIAGPAAGAEFPVRRERHLLGRGPGVDIVLDDQALSRQHAAIEYDGRTFRVRDLGSTNGIAVDGRVVQVAELNGGERIEVGSQVLRYVVEQREAEPEVYELTPEG